MKLPILATAAGRAPGAESGSPSYAYALEGEPGVTMQGYYCCTGQNAATCDMATKLNSYATCCVGASPQNPRYYRSKHNGAVRDCPGNVQTASGYLGMIGIPGY